METIPLAADHAQKALAPVTEQSGLSDFSDLSNFSDRAKQSDLVLENQKTAGSKLCASNTCVFSNYRIMSFIVPFLAVSAYSLNCNSACAVDGTHACAASALVVGALAGCTSLGAVTLILALKKLTKKA
jgi:hypothetical protein